MGIWETKSNIPSFIPTIDSVITVEAIGKRSQNVNGKTHKLNKCMRVYVEEF